MNPASSKAAPRDFGTRGLRELYDLFGNPDGSDG